MSAGGRHEVRSSASSRRRSSSSSSLGITNTSSTALPVAIVVVVSFILQALLSPNIAIGGICPNFFLIAIVLIANIAPQRTTIVMGFVCGLLFDLMGTGPVGAMALVLALAAFVLSQMAGTIKTDNFTAWIIVLAVLSLVVNLAFCIVVSITGYEQSFWAAIVFKVLPWALYDIVIAAIAWLVARHVMRPKGTQSLESRIKF